MNIRNKKKGKFFISMFGYLGDIDGILFSQIFKANNKVFHKKNELYINSKKMIKENI